MNTRLNRQQSEISQIKNSKSIKSADAHRATSASKCEKSAVRHKTDRTSKLNLTSSIRCKISASSHLLKADKHSQTTKIVISAPSKHIAQYSLVYFKLFYFKDMNLIRFNKKRHA